jgi:hypothetical protein
VESQIPRDFEIGGIRVPPQFKKMESPTQRSFCVIEHSKQIHAQMFSGSSKNIFIRNRLLEHQYRGDLTTLKTRDAFVRRKALTVFM